MKLTNLQKIKAFYPACSGKDYLGNDMNKVSKLIRQYREQGKYVTNGFWAIPKELEPKVFKKFRTEAIKQDIGELFTNVILAPKQEMQIEGLVPIGGGLKVKLKCDTFSSYVDPDFLTLVPALNIFNLKDVKIWQESALKPVLIDTDQNQSVMLIMPIRGEE